VQERALRSVPDLCETIDYAEVQGVLFPRVAVRDFISMVFAIAEMLCKLVGIHEDKDPDRQSCYISCALDNLCCPLPQLIDPPFQMTFLSMVKTLDQVRTVVVEFCSSYLSIMLGDINSKACTAAVKNPNKGACSNGKPLPYLRYFTTESRISRWQH
jgi:hypothetical protein